MDHENSEAGTSATKPDDSAMALMAIQTMQKRKALGNEEGKKKKKFKIEDSSKFDTNLTKDKEGGIELKPSGYVNNEPCDTGRPGVLYRLVIVYKFN